MYCITEQQIEYILNDIRRNGVETEDLQLNLLDHICCILEQELKDDDDFERFYKETIKQFYKTDLREIEDETINLLTFKNYYAMKKLMIVTGTIAAAAFVMGSLFKIMFWPGAGALLSLAMLSFSLVFMPLMVIMKVKEKTSAGEKLVTAAGALTAVLFCLSTLFKVQHWPGANVFLFSTIGVAAFVYIPAYYINGIRKPDKKLNTIVTSVILVSATGLLFTLIALRPPTLSPEHMAYYYDSELLLKDMQRNLGDSQQGNAEVKALAENINKICEQLKVQVLQNATGQEGSIQNFKTGKVIFYDRDIASYFWEDNTNTASLENLKAAVERYNALKMKEGAGKIPAELTILNIAADKTPKSTNAGILSGITQLQMYLVNTEHTGGKSMAGAN